MRQRVASILFFVLLASLVLACEAVSHANDFQMSSQTTVQSCGVGALLCGGQCTTVSADPENCGACGNACLGAEVCSNGACGSQCTGGLTQCGSKCVDTQNDPENCGQCGGPDSGACPICQTGVCRTQCLGGQDIRFCSNKKQCVDTQSDPSDCGGCVEKGGLVCPANQVCSKGQCVSSCGLGLTACAGACIDTNSDPNHCGSCIAQPCPTPLAHGVPVCLASSSNPTCGVACDEGYTYCKDIENRAECVDTELDPLNCGYCNHRCASGGTTTCSGGTCSN